jgi:hypothetical protein
MLRHHFLPEHSMGGLAGCGLLLLLQVACGNSIGPNETLLRGHWGSDEAELIAIGAGAELRFGCATALVESPITLTTAHTFVAAARVSGSFAALGPNPIVRLSGSLSGNQLTVSVPNVPSVPVFPGGTYVLEEGVELPPLEEPVCPQ